MITEFKAIIFDLDGVLIDSELFYYERRKKFLAQYGLAIDKIPRARFIGADMRSLWPIVFEMNQTELTRDFLSKEYSTFKKKNPINYTEWMNPQAKEVIRSLKVKGYKLGLASSSTVNVIEEVLAEGELAPYFDMIISGTQFEQSKPHPEIYQHTMKKLGVKKHECLVIEDSEKGIQASWAANLEVWAIKDTQFGMDQSKANRIINELNELCTLL